MVVLDNGRQLLLLLKKETICSNNCEKEMFGSCIGRYLPDIGMIIRVFANGPGDLGSIPCRVIPKTQKMVLDASLFNTQRYKVRIKGKVGQSWKRSSALLYSFMK